MNIYERDVTFKFLHDIITTRSRLFQIKKMDSPSCLICNSVESKLHMFIECVKVKSIFKYFKHLLNKNCDIRDFVDFNMLHLDFKASGKQKDTAIVLITSYIGCIWQNRESNKFITSNTLWTCILKQNHLLSLILKENMSNIYLLSNFAILRILNLQLLWHCNCF